MLVAHTTKDASLDINWDKFTSGNQSEMAGSIMFSSSKDVHYSFAVAFTRVKLSLTITALVLCVIISF